MAEIKFDTLICRPIISVMTDMHKKSPEPSTAGAGRTAVAFQVVSKGVSVWVVRLLERPNMTDQDLAELVTFSWMPSRIPLRDALSTFVPDAPEPEPLIEEMQNRTGGSVWYPVPGGHRVLMPHDGGEYDTSRFTIETRGWGYHEYCTLHGEHIPAMTLCYVTKPGQPYILLCSSCYDRYVTSKLNAAQ